MNGSPSSGQVLRLLALLGAMVVMGWLVYTIRGTLLPFVVAFVLSYILMPLVDYLESHRIHRLAAVAGVLLGITAILAVPVICGIPALLRGSEDMMRRMIGEQGQWACVIANPSESDETLWIDRVESSREDFKVEGVVWPIELAPGDWDTVRIVFSPEGKAVRTGVIRLYVRHGEGTAKPIALRLRGNVAGAGDSSSTAPLRELIIGAAQVAISDTAHVFGVYEPGYLAMFKTYTQSLQRQIDASFPMLGGSGDVAGYAHVKLQSMATELLQDTPTLLGQVLSGATFAIIVPLVLFFFLGEGRAIKRVLIEMVPNRYFEMVLNLLYRIDVQLGGYIRGMVLSVMIISMLSVTGLYLIGLEYFLVVGVLAGIANIIPYLGPLIGIIAGVVAVVLQYSTVNLAVVLPVVVVFLIVQILDNVFVAPVVVARSVNLHPLVVIFVVLVGSQLFGALGMLLAVPMTAVIKVSVQTVVEGLRSYSV